MCRGIFYAIVQDSQETLCSDSGKKVIIDIIEETIYIMRTIALWHVNEFSADISHRYFLAMGNHCSQSNTELVGYLFVDFPLCYQR